MDPRELLAGLSDPAAFPRAGREVEVRQTHISLVFLTGDRVYKVKKTLALWGFLDYSTLKRRRFYCEEEVRLNRRLAPDVYLGVEPVVRRGGRLAVGGAGEVVDYAVVMRRVADEDTLAERIRAGAADADEVAGVGLAIARFHDAADRGPDVRAVARPVAFARILRQNFEATRAAVPAVFPAALHAWLDRRIARLLCEARPALARRWREGWPVDGHGDLRAEHVVRVSGGRAASWAVIDCIEFAPTLRCIDPLSDAAFLAMDLASLGRRDLADAFLAAYVGARRDPDADALLPLFLAYRAHVRAKVDAHRAGEGEIPPADRDAARAGARLHFARTWAYARVGTPPPLVLLAGASGAGKSVVARALAPALGADLLSSDLERKRLAGLPPTARVSGDALAALYSRAMNVRTYAALVEGAERSLAAGRPAVLDATYLLRDVRAAAVAVARRRGALAAIVSIVVPEATARARIEARAEAGADASDATWDVHLAQTASAEPVRASEADVVLEHDGRRPADALALPLLDALARLDSVPQST